MTPELKTSCEVVFQEHKTSVAPVTWGKYPFRGRISIGLCEMAKETLVQKKVIYFPRPAKKTVTLLNPVVAAAETFEEAVTMIQNNVTSVATAVEEKPAYTASFHDFTDYPDEHTYQLVKNIGNPETVLISERWHHRPFFFYFVWPATALVAGALIARIMTEFVEMAYR